MTGACDTIAAFVATTGAGATYAALWCAIIGAADAYVIDGAAAYVLYGAATTEARYGAVTTWFTGAAATYLNCGEATYLTGGCVSPDFDTTALKPWTGSAVYATVRLLPSGSSNEYFFFCKY